MDVLVTFPIGSISLKPWNYVLRFWKRPRIKDFHFMLQ